MKIFSPAFKNGEEIPVEYSCSGKSINPPLQFDGVPGEAQSLVLILEDPDAPRGTFIHWLVWNIDPQTAGIAENGVPAGAIAGLTSVGEPGYVGPCPPSGTHRYVFRIFALDIKLDLFDRSNAAQVEKTMAGHILAQAELMGRYSHR